MVEDLMEEIRGALPGREPFEQQKECCRQRGGKLAFDGGWCRGVDGLWQPGANIVDSRAIGGAMDVERAARANGREPRRRCPYPAPIGIAPLEEAVLNGVLCVRPRP